MRSLKAGNRSLFLSPQDLTGSGTKHAVLRSVDKHLVSALRNLVIIICVNPTQPDYKLSELLFHLNPLSPAQALHKERMNT